MDGFIHRTLHPVQGEVGEVGREIGTFRKPLPFRWEQFPLKDDAGLEELAQDMLVHRGVLDQPIVLDVGITRLHIAVEDVRRGILAADHLDHIGVGVLGRAAGAEGKRFPLGIRFGHGDESISVQYQHGPVAVGGQLRIPLFAGVLGHQHDLPQR